MPTNHGSTTDDVTDALREAILDGTLAPHSWLRESDLADLLQVSRTPIREALRRLADEQLVERAANRGCQVRAMNLEDALAVYAVRESLEALAARTAALRRPPGLVQQLTDLHIQMQESGQDAAVTSNLNLAFHRAIRDAANNAYLERFLTQVEHAVRRLGISSFADPDRVEQIHVEHADILDAIAAGDADAAERAAARHMRLARDARISRMMLPHTKT